MKVSLNWLSEHLDLSDRSIEEISDLLTFAGIEVEGIEQMPDHLVVAEIKESKPHPDADKLSVCQVDDGGKSLRQIVCGAKNYKVGDKVPLALPGCTLTSVDGKPFTIKDGKLRGVDSHGMLCSASELGLSSEADGLLILPNDLKSGTPLSQVYPAVFDLEITPNRSDLLSHLGIARELAALTGTRLKGTASYGTPKTPVREAKKTEIQIADVETCPLYTGRIIRGVKVQPSPAWLQEKLHAIGLRPINNVVDITNYVLMETGQPLHAFDLGKLKGGIHVRRAKSGEMFHALDGQEYSLTPFDCVIADSTKPHALGGVMGGQESGVTEATTDILLEAAYFTPSHIRRTSQRLELKSDSSYRFERGTDPAQVAGVSEFAAKLIVELAGGTAEEAILQAGAAPVTEFTVPLETAHCRRLIGADLAVAEIVKILRSLGLKKAAGGWKIPSYRLDLRRPVDLIEEVARVYGLEKVPARCAASFVEPSKADRDYDFQRSLRARLAAIGFCECQTIKLIADKQLGDDLCALSANLKPVRVKNPMTDTHTHLRPGLVPSLLRVAEHNVRMGQSGLRLFEIGTVFSADPKGQEIEQTNLGLLLAGPGEDPSWRCAKPEAADLHVLRGVLEALVGKPLTLKPVKSERLLIAAEVLAGTAKLGVIGQLWPARARELDLNGAVLVGELNLKKLAAAAERTSGHVELPRFPAMTRDVAIEAPADLANQKILDLLAGLREPLLESYQLFDVFVDPTGEKLSKDKKSLAYSLTYRDKSGTLQASTVDEIHGRILDALKKGLPVQFR